MNGIKLFLDDTRRPPPGWVLVRTPEDAIAQLQKHQVVAISLDHDLGLRDPQTGRERTGYDVLAWIEEQVALTDWRPPKEINIHTSNPSARPKMKRAADSIKKLLERRDSKDPPLDFVDVWMVRSAPRGNSKFSGFWIGPFFSEESAEQSAANIASTVSKGILKTKAEIVSRTEVEVGGKTFMMLGQPRPVAHNVVDLPMPEMS